MNLENVEHLKQLLSLKEQNTISRTLAGQHGNFLNTPKRSRQDENVGRNAHAALLILLQLQSLNALGRAEISKRELQNLGEASVLEIGANMHSLGRLAMLKADELGKRGASQAITKLERAKHHFKNSSWIAWNFLNKLKRSRKDEDFGRNAHAALLILLQSLNVWDARRSTNESFKI